MSNHKPITNEDLAEMKEMFTSDWEKADDHGREILRRAARPYLVDCIAEIERLKEEVSTLRQLREYDAKELLEYKMKNLNL